MPFHEWSESMSVGVPLLDSDHQALVGFINELHDGLESGNEVTALWEILGKLVAYIEFRFVREESVMEACGYPHAEAHKQEHQAFTRYVHDVQDRYVRVANAATTREMLFHLKNWLSRHVLIQDMAYKKYTDMNPALASEVAAQFGPGLGHGARDSITGME